jgi:hypothetical protein
MWLFAFYFALSSPTPARAFDWSALGAECSDVLIPGIEPFLAEATAWDDFQSRAQTEITVLTDKTCPAYLQSANGAAGVVSGAAKMTLEKYIAAHTKTMQDAADSTGRGHKGDKFLEKNFSFISGLHAKGGFDFGGTSCGKKISAGRRYYADVIHRIEQKTNIAGKNCSQLADQIAARGPEAVARSYATGSGEIPTGPSAVQRSDITGTKPGEVFFDGVPARGISLKPLKVPDAAGSDVSGTTGGQAAASAEGSRADSSVGDDARAGSASGGGDPAKSGASAREGLEGSVVRGFTGRLAAPVAAADAPTSRGPASLASGRTPTAGSEGGPAPGVANAEIVPLQNEDKSRFARDFSSLQAEADRKGAEGRTIFELVSTRYRARHKDFQ